MNLLIINADQLRHDMIGCRGLHPVKTPNLDRLAAGSCVYTRAFTPVPVCAPARQALLCGRHPDSFGASWNYDQMKTLPTPTVQPDWCWTRGLVPAGYRTAYLGRFHVSPTYKPADFGYEKHVSWQGHKDLLKTKYADAKFTGGWLGCTSPVPVEDSGTHWMADRACEVLEEFAASGKPWHIWVDYEEPHLPCRPSEPFASMYTAGMVDKWDGCDDPFFHKPYIHRQQTISWDTDRYTWDDFSQMIARYYAVVSQLDDAIGRILRKLEETGQAEDTIVAFTSDHGDMCGSHQMLDKHYVLYDDICRVPFMVRYPGKKPALRDDFVYNVLDLPASIVRWLGLPAQAVEHGAPLPLEDDVNPAPRKYVSSTGEGQQMGLYTTRMIRDDRWKYVWNLTDVDELYDLDTDPGEKTNLIDRPEQAGRVSDMRRLLHDELISHNDPFAGNPWMENQLLNGRKYVPWTL